MSQSLDQWFKANPQVGAAAIAGLVALLTAIVANLWQPWSQRRLESFKREMQADIERLKARLDDEKSAATARRDYEYEARKRLYEQVEPLLFQLHESLEEAHYRIRSLARTARQGHLGLHGWLEEDSSYYLRSTCYKIFLPVVHFRLLQRRVTFIDLKLDESIALKYRLMKLYVRSFTDDFIFANLQPSLPYQPNGPNPARSSRGAEGSHTRQGLVLGDLESIADRLTVKDDTSTRAMQFTEFDGIVSDATTASQVGDLLDLMRGFSPEGRPVLARLLLAQACCAQLILSTYHRPTGVQQLPEMLKAVITDTGLLDAVSWVEHESADLAKARDYWSSRLEWLQTDASWIEVDRT